MSPRLSYYFWRVLGKATRPLLFFVMKLLSQARVLHGVQVWAMADTEDDEPLFAGVSEALDLIREKDPLRFRRLLRYAPRIIIVDGIDAAQIPDIGSCALGMQTVLGIPPSRLAATIVHEATHARARSAGVIVEPRTQAREEMLCVRESLAFLRRLPGTEGEITRLENLLQAELESGQPWFLAHPRGRA